MELGREGGGEYAVKYKHVEFKLLCIMASDVTSYQF